MRSTVLSLPPSGRMTLTLFAALLVFTTATLLVFAASLAEAPAASAQTTTSTEPDEPTFGVRCDFSHRNNDDPIVYPGNRGAAHSHDFFGNRSTKYNSTYASLLKAATKRDPDGTTCTRLEDKSAYWIPTVKWNDTILKASRGIFYYRANSKDPATVKPHPAGLKVVPNTGVEWRCEGGAYSTTPPTQCSNGQLGVRVVFPDCVSTDEQGRERLDSADHRSHVAYAVLQSDGERTCPQDKHSPETDSIPVPTLSALIRFPIPTTTGKVTLSSGEASTMHADFFNAWKQEEFDRMVKHCINDYVRRQESPDPVRPEDCKVPR